MHAAEWPHQGAQRGTCPFTGVAMNLSHTIALVIARPFVLTVIDCRMRQLQAMVTAILVRIDDRRVCWHGFGQNALTGGLITVTNQRAALFASLAADDLNDRRPSLS